MPRVKPINKILRELRRIDDPFVPALATMIKDAFEDLEKRLLSAQRRLPSHLYYLRNREKILARNKAWQLTEAGQASYARRRERQRKKWSTSEGKAKRRQIAREYYHKNKERIMERNREWYHSEAGQASYARRKALQKKEKS